MVAQQTAIWVVFSVCGLAVVTKGWNEGYSRKVCHVVMYLMPFLMHMVWPKQDGNDGASSNSQLPTVWVMSWTVWFQVRLGAFPNIRHCLPCTAYVIFTAVLTLVTASAATRVLPPHGRPHIVDCLLTVRKSPNTPDSKLTKFFPLPVRSFLPAD